MQWSGILRQPGCRFVDLQYGDTTAERAAFTRETGVSIEHVPDLDLFNDLEGLAALCAACDLVITVSNVTAHVAGALGRPVWLLTPEPAGKHWYWFAERSDSPWYPTLRLFRQKHPGNWRDALETVASSLRDEVARVAPAPGPADKSTPPATSVMRSAVALLKQREYAQAERLCRGVLDAEPARPDALNLLGVCRRLQGDVDEALALIARAIEGDGKVPAYHANLGHVHKDLRQYEQAAACYGEALRLKPDYAEACHHLALTWISRDRPDLAVTGFRDALRIDPAHAESWVRLGTLARQQGDLEESERCYREALRVRPGYTEAYFALGPLLITMGKVKDGEQCIRTAIESKPDHAEAHWNLALARLLLGDLKEGFREYEWRWETEGLRNRKLQTPRPQWQGGDIAGKRILLHVEQGLGDAIQFIRYAPLVAERGARVIVASRPETARLFAGVAGVSQVVASGEAPPDFDVHSPLLSLPHVFGTTLDTVPNAVPYLAADAGLAKAWRARLARKGRGLKVGLAWAGGRAHAGDRWRSLSAAVLEPLFHVPGVTWYSLQKDAPEGALPPSAKLIDHTALLRDFAETAALVENLDLVISVDTAVAHLAGALGKPVWVMLPFAPDWRWLLAGEETVWYPTMRLYRQDRAGDWDRVIERLGDALARKAKGRPRPPAG
jgi:tetratricopeptide (TPR) repeat protein